MQHQGIAACNLCGRMVQECRCHPRDIRIWMTLERIADAQEQTAKAVMMLVALATAKLEQEAKAAAAIRKYGTSRGGSKEKDGDTEGEDEEEALTQPETLSSCTITTDKAARALRVGLRGFSLDDWCRS